ncbi:MAG: RNA polymerase sigma factor WhiG [Planctomycetota bacterium]|nr:MAG: RNA polymerase sigma factor WhiG [Planctomycetota bacterium]
MSSCGYTTLRSKAERDQLIEQYLPLVSHVLGRLSFALPPDVERDDLHSAGVLGLIHAAEHYDANRGASFKTFAYTAIRGAILDELRRLDPVPRTQRERIRAIEAAERELHARLGRTPTKGELRQYLSWPEGDFDKALAALHTAQVLSLNTTTEGGEGGGIEAIQLVEDSFIGRPELHVETEEEIARLSHEIGKLPKQSAQVIVLYYYEGLLLKQIGQVLGVSESRACQILSKSLAQLKLAMSD